MCGFPAKTLRTSSDAPFSSRGDSAAVQRRSYAIWWSEGDGARRTGKLEVASCCALLSGQGGSRVEVPLEEITTIDYRRGRLQLGRRHDAAISIGSLDAPGALLELADALRAA